MTYFGIGISNQDRFALEKRLPSDHARSTASEDEKYNSKLDLIVLIENTTTAWSNNMMFQNPALPSPRDALSSLFSIQSVRPIGQEWKRYEN